MRDPGNEVLQVVSNLVSDRRSKGTKTLGTRVSILFPIGHSPFGQHQESRPLAPTSGPTPEVRDSQTSRHSAHAQSQV